jgi:hypothetical protein
MSAEIHYILKGGFRFYVKVIVLWYRNGRFYEPNEQKEFLFGDINVSFRKKGAFLINTIN